MDKFGDYISVVLRGVHIDKIRRKELAEEIHDHLEMTKNELVQEGYKVEEAELTAIKRFGDIEDIKERFNRVFTPYRRLKEAMNRKRWLKESLQWAVCIFVALFVSLSIRSYAFAVTEVKQCSMQNTLFEGQKLIENKFEYYHSTPVRGDIVIINEKLERGVINKFVENTKELIGEVCNKDETEKNRLIKRVIGVPGDKIDILEGKIYLNGQLYSESYVKGSTFPGTMQFPITIPEGEYFVLGDNRENSMDSREIGLININEIEGKAVLRLWPLDKFGSISVSQK